MHFMVVYAECRQDRVYIVRLYRVKLSKFAEERARTCKHAHTCKASHKRHNTHHTQYLVRGNCDAEYHKDAAEPTLDKLQESGIGYDVLGGGRIQVISMSSLI